MVQFVVVYMHISLENLKMLQKSCSSPSITNYLTGPEFKEWDPDPERSEK